MPAWFIFAALATIAITALLTWVLWRLNAPAGGNRVSGADTDAAAESD